MRGRLVAQVSLVLLVIGAGVLFSGCALGFRAPASDITTTSATLNGGVGSNRSEHGEWWFEYGKTTDLGNETPHRGIDFTAFTGYDVSEPVSGLEPGTTYHYVNCADDQDPDFGPNCSHQQTFTTDFDPSLTLTEDCSFYPPDNGLVISGTGFPPNTRFHMTVDPPVGGTFTVDGPIDESGNFSFGPPPIPNAGTWTATVEWSGGTLVESLFVDCAAPSQPDT
jgi:hypothetical protein